MTVRLLQNDIEDPGSRENFRRLEGFLRDEPVLRGNFAFREFSLSASSYPATVRVKHNLGFVPKDVVQTSAVGSGGLSAGMVVWEYAQFTATEVVASIPDAVTFRGFFGSYSEGRTA